MNSKKIKLLFEKALANADKVNFSEFDSIYTQAIDSGNFHDAIQVSFLMYLQGQLSGDPETDAVLGLLKTTIELYLGRSGDGEKGSTEKRSEQKNPVYCTFCGKSEKEVQKLIAGPGGVYICNETIDVCVDLLRKDRNKENTGRARRPVKAKLKKRKLPQ
jgi:ClpX C4-type zinc finger